MPGVLIVEAMAQAAGALVMHSLGWSAENRLVYFMTIEKARFRRPVRPGDMLRMPVKALRRRGPVWRFAGEAFRRRHTVRGSRIQRHDRRRIQADDENPSDSDR